MFGVAVFTAVVNALLTGGSQAKKAALANPIK
jgi:hypothetical protein